MKPDHEPEKPSRDSPESAADYLRGADRANPRHDDDWHTREQRHAVETERLREWARNCGIFGGRSIREDARGSEHIVQIGRGTERVLKQTRPESHAGFGLHLNNSGQGATPGEYLDRLANHNRIFEDDVRIEHVVNLGGRLSIVTSQRYIAGRAAAPEEIDAVMAGKGFACIGNGIFYHADERLLVSDMHPKNAVFSQGCAVPIDTAIQRAAPQFAQFIQANPTRFG